MLYKKKIVIVLPSYNSEKTLEKTYSELPFDIVDDVIFVDDASRDNSIEIARNLGIKHIIGHEANKGYGGNQKTCYTKALAIGADIVVMIHPDYQYTPKLVHSMCYLIANDVYKVVLGSRILGKGALEGGMPVYKYFFNRILTLTQNIIIGQKLSEYHTGFRAFAREVLEKINYEVNSDDFIFDNEILSQIFIAGYQIGEITCPTKYAEDSSSINLIRSMKYGLGVVKTSVLHRLHLWKLYKSKLYKLKNIPL